MPTAYIVDAVRTAGGKRKGALATWHPVDLAAHILDALIERTGVDPAHIEDVIMGCVTQTGEQGLHVGRNAVLASRLPITVPSVTIDRQCGSSQQSVQFAAQAVMSGTSDLVIAAGVESMTRVPMYSQGAFSEHPEPGNAKSPGLERTYPGVAFSQFPGAEMLARQHGYDREALDRFALESHRRAHAATVGGAFAREIVPVPVETADGNAALHIVDEGIRADASIEAIGAVKTLQPGGIVTAANSSQICDGASAVLIASGQAVRDLGLNPIARVDAFAVTAGDPILMLAEPAPATERALQRAGRRFEDIDLYEINEAFAPVPMAWRDHFHADPARMNVHGGAIALGHPLGASGTKLLATLIHALRARGDRFGIQAMCEGGGMANAMIVEAL